MHTKLENIKYEQINNLLLGVKLSALLFCAIICFKYLADKNLDANIIEYATVFSMILIGVLLLSVYLIGSTLTFKKLASSVEKYIHTIENIIFISIFLVMIIVSGGTESPYKCLFLLIIITTTIQAGMKEGIIVAGISGLLILGVDLVYVPNVTVNPYFEDDLILTGIFMLTACIVGYYLKLERQHIEELKDKVNQDGLTGVYNYRFFQDILRNKIEIAIKTATPVSMLFIDIDNFKYYNDLNGHQKGDEVLREVGQLIAGSVREGDIVAKYGGVEFAIILPDTGAKDVIAVAEKVRCAIQDTYIIGQENQPTGNLTISVGIATYPDNAKDEVELIKSADDALYRAKFFNKNKVEVYVSVLDELKKDINEEENELVTSIKTLISVINAKDKYTYGHCERVVMYSRIVAEYLGLNEKDKKSLVYGAYMHDIGKINISEQVLNKRMPLDKAEWELLKKHPEYGVEIITTVEALVDTKPIIYYHHERYDGTGYPDGLKGEEIPFLSRILTVVDSFDAITSNRPYNRRKSYEEGFRELRKFKGTQFDPEIVEVFITAFTNAKDDLNT